MKPISRELAALLAPRIMQSVKVTRNDGCWIRTKYVHPVTGYTSISRKINGKQSYFLAHRVMYVMWNGEIPEGLTIDHLCEVVACCNPSHLRAVPQRENVLRSRKNPAAINARKTTCSRGHALATHPSGRRYCPACKRKAAKEARARRRSQGVPAGESHGTRSSYHRWCCRCDECKAWQRADYLERKAAGRP